MSHELKPARPAGARRWVSLDVGETLIDETRIWSVWADELRIPRLTFMAAFGAAVERGGEHRDVFSILGVPGWLDFLPRVMETYGAFRADDLYPDAVPSLRALHSAGYRICLAANQPAERAAQLRALSVPADVMVMSDEIGVWKPDPAFFAQALALMGDPDPSSVVYVGDRIDNDVLPAAAAGMRAVWLRRGPWGVIARSAPAEASLVVDSLHELVEGIGACWPSEAAEAN